MPTSGESTSEVLRLLLLYQRESAASVVPDKSG
jgi:hypothetical protein